MLNRDVAPSDLAMITLIVLGSAAGSFAFAGVNAPNIAFHVMGTSAEWAHVMVTFSLVDIHQSSAISGSGWLTVPLARQTIDLTTPPDLSSLLALGHVGAGNYTQIRLVVSSAFGVMTDGTKVSFTIPSDELKTTTPFQIVSGEVRFITVEINLARSIVHNSQGWTFTPVLGQIIES